MSIVKPPLRTLLVCCSALLGMCLLLLLLLELGNMYLSNLFQLSITLIAVGISLTVARTLRSSLTAPYVIFCSVICSVMILGQVFSGLVSRYATETAFDLSSSAVIDTAELFLMTILGFTFGHIVAFFALPTPTSQRSTPLSAVDPSVILLAACIPLFLELYSAGIGNLVSRPEYLFSEPGIAGALASPGSIVALIFAGYALPFMSIAQRLFTTVLVAGYFIIFFSMGTRIFALIPVLLVLGFYFSRSTRSRYVFFFFGALLSFLLLPVPLYLRGLAAHGLIPYLRNISGVFALGHPYLEALANIVSSFNIVGATLNNSEQITASLLAIELNPSSGSSSGWYQISSSMRINDFAPFSAIGELGNYGLGAAFLFWAAVGATLNIFHSQSSKIFRRFSQVHQMLLAGVTLLFTILCLQYNLRSASRVLYYLVFLELLAFLLLAAKSYLDNQRRGNST